jgi:hypothetical protein
LPQAAKRLEQITLLREHPPLGRVQQELYRVETQSATLMGRWRGTCPASMTMRLLRATTSRPSPPPATSRKAGPTGVPRMFQRFLPVYTGNGDPWHGLYLAEQATVRAADGSSHVVASWSAAFAAEAAPPIAASR